MIEPTMFTDEENWNGGFYELAIEIGDTDDHRLQSVLSALWNAAGVEGCFGDRYQEPAAQQEVPCSVASLAEFGHLQGIVQLPSGHRVVCGCVAIREDDGPDWLDFYLPLGALSRVEPEIGGFPFDDESGPASLAWRHPLDDWLANVATNVLNTADFRLGLIGFEVSGTTYSHRLNGAAPQERWNGYLLPVNGTLRYEPANR
ncbi:hypothetical protein ACFVH6_32495 [Spirillospora sp. NPDC127200]